MSDYGCVKCGAANPEFCIAEDGDWEPGAYLGGLCKKCAIEVGFEGVVAKHEGIRAEEVAFKDSLLARMGGKSSATWTEPDYNRSLRRNLKQAVKRLIDTDNG